MPVDDAPLMFAFTLLADLCSVSFTGQNRGLEQKIREGQTTYIPQEKVDTSFIHNPPQPHHLLMLLQQHCQKEYIHWKRVSSIGSQAFLITFWSLDPELVNIRMIWGRSSLSPISPAQLPTTLQTLRVILT
jgi:hypothetical protein